MGRTLLCVVTLLLAASAGGATAHQPLVAFRSTQGGNLESIVLLDEDGREVARPTAGKPRPVDSMFSWSPDGSRLAYAGGEFLYSDVYAVSADGRELVRLTRDAGSGLVYDDSPAWSPDGGRIAFLQTRRVRTRNGTFDLEADVWLVGADGSGQRRLTHDGGYKSPPVWSPHGSQLAYSTFGGSVVLDVETGVARLRVRRAGVTGWSPDGAWLAAVSGNGLEVVDATTGARRVVAAAPVSAVSWSPDARSLAFSRSRCAASLRGICMQRVSSVYVVGADGTGERRLTGRLGDVGPIGFPYDSAESPSWWPGGARLFFLRDGAAWTMNADGTCERPFGPQALNLRAGAWRPGVAPAAVSERCTDLVLDLRALRDPVGRRTATPLALVVRNDGTEPASAAYVTWRVLSRRGRIHVRSHACGRAGRIVRCELGALAPGASVRVAAAVAGAAPPAYAVRVSAGARERDPTREAMEIAGSVLPCDIVGTRGRDRSLRGSRRRDVICALAGDDTVFSRDGVGDSIDCGAGRDTLYADRFDVARRCERVRRG